MKVKEDWELVEESCLRHFALEPKRIDGFTRWLTHCGKIVGEDQRWHNKHLSPCEECHRYART